MKRNLTVKDSSMAFVSGFLFSQFFTALMLVVASVFFHTNSTNIDLNAFSKSVIGYTILSITLQVGILLVFLYFNQSKENKITEKFSWKKLGLYSIIAITSFFLLAPCSACIEKLLTKLKFSSNGFKYDLNTKTYFISLISLVIFPAICEELLFRGLIFKGLKRYGKKLSVFLSALAFSIFHMSIFQSVYPLLFGLLLGIIMYRENNIIYTITIHGINNFLSLTFALFKIDFFIKHWLFVVFAILLVIIFLILLSFIVKTTKETQKEKLSKIEVISLAISFVIMIVLWIIFNIYGT